MFVVFLFACCVLSDARKQLASKQYVDSKVGNATSSIATQLNNKLNASSVVHSAQGEYADDDVLSARTAVGTFATNATLTALEQSTYRREDVDQLLEAYRKTGDLSVGTGDDATTLATLRDIPDDFYSREAIDAKVTELNKSITAAASGDYLPMSSVINKTQEEYNDGDVLTAGVLFDTFANNTAFNALSDNVYTKADIDKKIIGDYREYISESEGKCFTRKDGNTWMLESHPDADTYTLNILFTSGDSKLEESVVVVNNAVVSQTHTDITGSGANRYYFNPSEFTFYIDTNSAYVNFRPYGSSSTACITSMYTGDSKGVLNDYYTKSDVDSITAELNKSIMAVTGGDYLPKANVKSAAESYGAYDVLSAAYIATAFTNKSEHDSVKATADAALPKANVKDSIPDPVDTAGDYDVLSIEASLNAFASKADVSTLSATVSGMYSNQQIDDKIKPLVASSALVREHTQGTASYDDDKIFTANAVLGIVSEKNSTWVEGIVDGIGAYYKKGSRVIYDNSDGKYTITDPHGYLNIPKPDVATYTVTIENILKDNRGIVMYTVDVIDSEVSTITRSAVIDGVSTTNSEHGAFTGFEFSINSEQLGIGYDAHESHKNDFAEIRLVSVTAPVDDSDAITADMVHMALLDDDHILTAAATKSIIDDTSDRAYTSTNTSQFTINKNKLNKLVYLVIEACDDDYIYEGVLPYDIVSINDECIVNISQSNDDVVFSVLDHESQKQQFDIRLVVY